MEEEYLKERGVEYLQVKTLSPLRLDEDLERTRAFSAAMGSRALDVFPEFWGEANPCLQVIKRL